MPADYSDQDITSTNLTSADLSGANFTNTNATSVNFTNANITNANFTNTLITSATLTGITFSNVQKGQLLLRAANISISAVNNLSSLTIPELRKIQSAISLRSLNLIQTITVAIPNSGGGGYTVSITPSLTQAVCIFVAVNQNVIISSSGSVVKTIKSNGTVIQDVDNGSSTLSYLRVGTTLYKPSIGNGNGVILLVPSDLNMIRVNDVGISDFISYNSSLTNVYSMSWGDGGTTKCAKVTFTLPSTIDLRTNKVRVSMKVRSNLSYLNYPMLIFNDNHSYPSDNNYANEMSTMTSAWTGASGTYNVFPNNTPTHALWNDGSMCFHATIHPTSASDPFWLLNFWIELAYDNGNGGYKQMVARGDWALIDKTLGSRSNVYSWSGTFTRISELAGPTYLLNKIGFGSYSNGTNFSNALKAATINVEVVSTSFISGGTTTL